MIGYIRGEIADIGESGVIIDNHGIGWRVFMPASQCAQVSVGDEVRVWTYMSVREDAMDLFGFLSKDALAVFKLLIGVSGVGPKAALGILSTLSPDELRLAVLSDDTNAITKAPGIGRKTAQKLILELKDKVKLPDVPGGKNDSGGVELSDGRSGASSSAANDAIAALTALGYSSSEALRAVRAADITEDMSTEEILKAALKKIF